jgi:ubiquinone/menaquinone biosynthesis C-methylase UbiE
MGSQATQAKLWGQRTKDWSDIQEPTGKALYEFVLDQFPIRPGQRLLDIGCGTGYFIKMAADKGLEVTGLDATAEFITEAKRRVPEAIFLVGEMEQLPFEEKQFDYVTGFNSFQYAADTKNALAEARRVLRDDGKLVSMIWGNREDCEAASYLKAIGSLLPPPPPGAAGPFALTENQALENILKATGFKILINTDLPSIWDYPDLSTAMKGLLSSGPAARAIEHSGYEEVTDILLQAIEPYVQKNEHVLYKNKFRVIIAEK